MRIVHFEKEGVPGIAADDGSGWHGLTARETGFPGALPELIAQGADLLRIGGDLLAIPAIDLNAVRILPPAPNPPKILCVGVNYDDHIEESGLKDPIVTHDGQILDGINRQDACLRAKREPKYVPKMPETEIE